jgi:hypothetical protein
LLIEKLNYFIIAKATVKIKCNKLFFVDFFICVALLTLHQCLNLELFHSDPQERRQNFMRNPCQFWLPASGWGATTECSDVRPFFLIYRGGLVSIPQCIAVLDHCIHIINSPAQLVQCSLAVVVNTSLQKIYRFRKWRIFFAPGMGLKLLFWKQWSTSSDLCLLRLHSLYI